MPSVIQPFHHPLIHPFLRSFCHSLSIHPALRSFFIIQSFLIHTFIPSLPSPIHLLILHPPPIYPSSLHLFITCSFLVIQSFTNQPLILHHPCVNYHHSSIILHHPFSITYFSINLSSSTHSSSHHTFIIYLFPII